jgi:hypothetical protein
MLGTDTAPGVLLLAVSDIFRLIRATPSRQFLLKASYMEICMYFYLLPWFLLLFIFFFSVSWI